MPNLYQTSIFADSDFSTFNVTATTTGNGSGHVSGLGTYNAESTATLTAVASAGSVFAGWQPSSTADQVCSLGGKGPAEASTTNPCTFQLSGWSQRTLTAVAEFDKSSAIVPPPPTAAPVANPTPSSIAVASPSPIPLASGSAVAGVVLQQVKVNNRIVQQNCSLTIPSNQVLAISGTTAPKGTVNLTIHSKTRHEAVVADASGRWSATITGLEPGTHHVDASLTDSATHMTYPSATLISFNVVSPNQSGGSEHYPDVWVVLALALLAAVLVLAVPYLARRAL
jgi:hypothetical protein